MSVLPMFEYECWKCDQWHTLGNEASTISEALAIMAWTGATVREKKIKK